MRVLPSKQGYHEHKHRSAKLAYDEETEVIMLRRIPEANLQVPLQHQLQPLQILSWTWSFSVLMQSLLPKHDTKSSF